jgi:hypothetical protein
MIVTTTTYPGVREADQPFFSNCPVARGGIEDGAIKVDDVVRTAEHNYVAAIGGDIHNYQRYPVRVGNRKIQYFVSGGGGAYMSDTHRIP